MRLAAGQALHDLFCTNCKGHNQANGSAHFTRSGRSFGHSQEISPQPEGPLPTRCMKRIQYEIAQPFRLQRGHHSRHYLFVTNGGLSHHT